VAATPLLIDPGPKDISFGTDARSRVLSGIDLALATVGVTLGPRGSTVLIEKQNAKPELSRDGYVIIRSIELDDRGADMGARMLREVAHQTDISVGDGTTTAVVLTGVMVRRGLTAVAAGLTPLGVKRGIDKAVKAAISALDRQSRSVRSSSDVENIATISANGDREVGQIISRAVESIGSEGYVVVEEGSTREIELELRDGMHVDGGYLSSHFHTDSQRMVVEMDDPYILLHDGKIESFDAIEPALRAFAKSGKWLLVIAEDVVGEALTSLVVNHRDGGLKVAAAKAPGVGARRKAMLEDIAIMTGAELVTGDLGNTISRLRPEMLGRAKRVVLSAGFTTIVDGAGKKKAVTARCVELRKAIERERYLAYDREQLQQRLARLVSGIAVVRVGGDTEVEIDQRKQMVEDAVNSTRAAVAEGILPGGGVSLARAVIDVSLIETESIDERAGINAVLRSLSEPFKLIVESGGEDGNLAVAKLMEHKDRGWGYDAVRGKFANMVKSGVIDPTRVVKVGLANAASTAGLVITTETMVAKRLEPKKVSRAFSEE